MKKAGTDADGGNAVLNTLYYIAYPHRMAGASRQLLELIRSLPPYVRPCVVVAQEGRVADHFMAEGIDCVVLPAPGRLSRFGRRIKGFSLLEKVEMALLDLPPYTLSLRGLLRDRGIELIHLNDPRGAAIAGPAAALSGIPVIQHLRGEYSHGRLGRAVFETLPATIIVNAEGPGETLSPRGKAKSVTIYDGLLEVSQPASTIPWLHQVKERGISVVCIFASVVPFKGHHHLIDAVAELNRRGIGEEAVFVCVGDLVAGYEWYHRWLFDKMAAHGVENVTFAGWQDDPFSFYAAADMTVLPSVSRETLTVGNRVVEVKGNEGFPQTHLEAMVCGLPIVGTRISGVGEQVIHGDTGILIPPGDVSELASAMERLLADRDLRLRFGAAGRDRIRRHFSPSAHRDSVLNVYRRVLPNHPVWSLA